MLPAELLLVAARLGDLCDRVVFVGGMVRGLLVTDPAVVGPRPTRDVDLITELPSTIAYYAMGEELRRRGFRESQEEDAPICRWNIDDVPVDVMPIDPVVLGFSNVWYRGGFDCSTELVTGALRLRIIDAPHFCATKLESFASRGGGDFYHHDLEDVIVLVDGRPELMAEVRAAPRDLRNFLAKEISALLASTRFMDALPGHLGPDVASQGRLALIIARLRAFAALSVAEVASSAVRPPPQPPKPPSGRRNEDAAFRPTPNREAPAWHPQRSTSIRNATYEAVTRTLTVEFRRDSVYEYYDVPATIWAGWQRAASAGQYHHQWIRPRYKYRRIR
jgi:hypothetical protein